MATAPSGQAPAPKKAFSSRILQMKFMQRAEEKKNLVEKVKEEEQRVDDSKWTLATGTSSCKVFVERDPLPAALVGRMSFQNFNPATEALLKDHAEVREAAAAAQKAAEAAKQAEASVEDEEMANALKRPATHAAATEYAPLRQKKAKMR